MAQDLKVAPGKKYTGPVVPYRDAVGGDWPGTPVFTNLSPPTTGVPTLYDFDDGGYYVLGPSNCLGLAQQAISVSFWTGPTAPTVRQLQAAVVQEPTCLSTAKVLLGLWTDNGAEPEAPLALIVSKVATVPTTVGGLATAKIPATALAANTHYWLTASTAPGPANANLAAIWYSSNNAEIGFSQDGTLTWGGFSGLTPAGQVK